MPAAADGLGDLCGAAKAEKSEDVLPKRATGQVGHSKILQDSDFTTYSSNWDWRVKRVKACKMRPSRMFSTHPSTNRAVYRRCTDAPFV
mmetsp:Transcript_80526/g.118058  ORF Transcript_80526/g.118058 Transcript_80526/m.118058 type:complete len:89 (-) Transcript_80526:870-1136(-)